MSVSAEPGSNIVLHGIRWETYERLLEDLWDHGPRLTYADGDLEIMSPVSFGHERSARLLGRMIEAMTEELSIPIKSGRSTTFRKKRAKAGFEPDECYWVQHEAAVRRVKDTIDLAVHPAPDLVIESEASRSAIDKLPLFARLGVGEAWRVEGTRLTVHVRDDRTMRERAASRCFPCLPLDEFAAWLAAADGQDETSWIRSFRVWVRERLLPARA